QVDFCFRDGSPLRLLNGASSVVEDAAPSAGGSAGPGHGPLMTEDLFAVPEPQGLSSTSASGGGDAAALDAPEPRAIAAPLKRPRPEGISPGEEVLDGPQNLQAPTLTPDPDVTEDTAELDAASPPDVRAPPSPMMGLEEELEPAIADDLDSSTAILNKDALDELLREEARRAKASPPTLIPEETTLHPSPDVDLSALASPTAAAISPSGGPAPVSSGKPPRPPSASAFRIPPREEEPERAAVGGVLLFFGGAAAAVAFFGIGGFIAWQMGMFDPALDPPRQDVVADVAEVADPEPDPRSAPDAAPPKPEPPPEVEPPAAPVIATPEPVLSRDPDPEPARAAQPDPAPDPEAVVPVAEPSEAPVAVELDPDPAPTIEPAPVPVETPEPVKPPEPEAVAVVAPPDDGNPWGTPEDAVSEGEVTITTNPLGARVSIDTKPLGRSPVTTTLGYGVHNIQVELDGHQTAVKTIDVKSDAMSVPFELKLATETVQIFGHEGSMIYIDGQKVGTSPVNTRLTPGRYSFRVVSPDGTSFTATHDITFAQGAPVRINLNQ
ncbi:MAG: PEGA domain-containing protein, partial [Myxococcota bacterium]